jgi:hypothetical protein
MKAISYLSKFGEQEHKKKNQKIDTMIYLPKFGITTRDPYVSVEVAWITHHEPTSSRIFFNHFSYFTSSCFFPYGGEVDFYKKIHGSPHQAVAQG